MTDPVDEQKRQLERELNLDSNQGIPFIPPRNGANCFLDQHRVCAPDCVAWNEEANAKFGDGPRCCVLLVSAAQIPPALIGIAKLMKTPKSAPPAPPPPPIVYR